MYRPDRSRFVGNTSNQSSSRSSTNAPVKVGEVREVTIEDTARQGDGIARVEGFVIFVPNTKVNDHVKIEIKELKRSCAIAEVVE
ncbi:MAG: TRAM domain-containing protein [Halobacteriota archaeon]